MVQRIILIVVLLLVVLTITSYMGTYTVRFTETAVVTRAGARLATVDEPGLRFKLPFVDSVTKYDKRLRLLKTRSVTQQTADESQIIVEAFATWRVSDPYLYYQRFRNAGASAEQHYEAADGILRSRLLSALSEVSRYSLTDLFTQAPGGTKLPELEARILESMRSDASGVGGGGGGGGAGATEGGQGALGTLASYGVEVNFVGINRVLLPEGTINKVVDRMGATRDRLAQELESQGDAEATRITSQAQAEAAKIRAFAQRLANEIVARGESEAAEYLAVQNSHPDFATFLQNLEFIRGIATKKATLILPASTFGFSLFSAESLTGLADEQVPVRAPGTASDLRVTELGGAGGDGR